MMSLQQPLRIGSPRGLAGGRELAGSLVLAGALIAPLHGGGGLAAADELERRPPVVAAPRHLEALVHDESKRVASRPAETDRSGRCQCPSDRLPRAVPAPPRVPFGAANRSLFGAQVANGQAARLVLYQYDFARGKAELSAAGRQKLARLVPLFARSPFPLIIEPHGGSPELDRLRRRHVIDWLAETMPVVPAERIVVAPPPSRGLSGDEAHNLYLRFLEMSAVGGVPEDVPGLVSPLAPR